MAVVVGVSVALESRSSGLRSAAIFGATASIASLIVFLAGSLASHVNPDFNSRSVSTALDEGAAAAAAAAALAWLLAGAAQPNARHHPGGSLAAAMKEIWAARPARRMAAGFLVQATLTAGLSSLGFLLASRIASGSLVNVLRTNSWLSPSALAIGLLGGAFLVDRRRSASRGAAAVAMWAVGAGLLLYLFSVNVDDAGQSAAFLAVAAGACALAWAPTLAAVNDCTGVANRTAALGAVLMLSAQLGTIGLPALSEALAIKLAGAATWSFKASFWGRLAMSMSPSTSSSVGPYLLPVRIDASLGDPESALHTLRTGAILLALALAISVYLYRAAGPGRMPDTSRPEAPLAKPPACPRCGVENDPQDRFCHACGGRLPGVAAAQARPAVQDDRNPLPALLIGLGVAALVATAAMLADAQGLFHKRWTTSIVWKSPAGADEEIKGCKDWPCLYSVLKKYKAPDETTRFLKRQQEEAFTDSLEYPVAFNGKGRVRAVQMFIPGFGMEGVSEVIFVNGTKPFVRPTDNIEEAANANAAYQDFKLQYPQASPGTTSSSARRRSHGTDHSSLSFNRPC